MRQLLFFLSIIILMSSCKMVFFEEPQPPGVSSIKTFPVDWQGKYRLNEDTVTIGDSYIILPVLGKLTKFELTSDTILLKQFKEDIYVLNYFLLNDTMHYWITLVMKKNGKKIYNYLIDYDEDTPKKLDKLGIKYEIREKDIIIKKITYEQFEKLLDNKVFTVTSIFKKIE